MIELDDEMQKKLDLVKNKAINGDPEAYTSLIEHTRHSDGSVRKESVFSLRCVTQQDESLFKQGVEALIERLSDTDLMIAWTSGTSLQSLRGDEKYNKERLNIILDLMSKAIKTENLHVINSSLKSFAEEEFSRGYSSKQQKYITSKCIIPNLEFILRAINEHLPSDSSEPMRVIEKKGENCMTIRRPGYEHFESLAITSSLNLIIAFDAFSENEETVISSLQAEKIVPILEEAIPRLPLCQNFLLGIYLMMNPGDFIGSKKMLEELANLNIDPDMLPFCFIKTKSGEYENEAQLAKYLLYKIGKIKTS